jgi:hypothetical protein
MDPALRGRLFEIQIESADCGRDSFQEVLFDLPVRWWFVACLCFSSLLIQMEQTRPGCGSEHRFILANEVFRRGFGGWVVLRDESRDPGAFIEIQMNQRDCGTRFVSGTAFRFACSPILWAHVSVSILIQMERNGSRGCGSQHFFIRAN